MQLVWLFYNAVTDTGTKSCAMDPGAVECLWTVNSKWCGVERDPLTNSWPYIFDTAVSGVEVQHMVLKSIYVERKSPFLIEL